MDSSLLQNAEEYRKWWEENAPNGVPYGYCWCLCGRKTPIAPKTYRKGLYFRGEPRRFLRGHNTALSEEEVELSRQRLKEGYKRREQRNRERHTEHYYAEILSNPKLGKVCPKCGEWKPYKGFLREGLRGDGFSCRCRTCRQHDMRFHRKKSKYGIDEGDYLKLIAIQDERCVICQRHKDEVRLGVDHCHTSGVVRGLLCTACNSGLGYFQDNPVLLLRALHYLAMGAGYGEGETQVLDYLDTWIEHTNKRNYVLPKSTRRKHY